MKMPLSLGRWTGLQNRFRRFESVQRCQIYEDSEMHAVWEAADAETTSDRHPLVQSEVTLEWNVLAWC